MYSVILDSNNKIIHDPSQNDPGLLLVDGVIGKQVNCADSFTFTIYPDNVGYSDIDLMSTWLTVKKDADVIFHGRVLNTEQGWMNEKRVSCEGDLAILVDSVLRPYTFTGTLQDYFTMLVNQHNAQVGADKQITVGTIANPTTPMVRSTGDYKPTLQELREKILDYFGGYLVMNYENGVRTLSYVTDSTSGTSQTLEVGKNILDFNRKISAESLATAIIPLGAVDDATGERLTIKSVNGGLDYLTSPDAATKGLIYAVYTFDSITDAAALKAKGQEVLTDLTRMIPRIELSAVDLSDSGYNIDAIGFFEYVTLQDTAHDASGQYLISERTYNISAPEQDTVTFGSEEKTISGQAARAQVDLSTMTDTVINKAVDIVKYQTDLLKGADGGYFVIGTNADGQPSETFWMDTDSVDTAVKVLRINYNGIGFSSSGIGGPYGSAWTLDAKFNADYIQVGTLDCDLITVMNLDGSSIKANTLELNQFSNAAQAAIISDAKTQQEYYLSTSDVSATGGSWSTTIPTWSTGKYIWTRTKNTVTDSAGTSSSSYVPSASGQYDVALTTALATAEAASGAAGNSLVSSVPLYYRSTSSTPPARPVAEVTSTSTGSGVWTLAMPAPSRGCYFFTCNQYKLANNTVDWSAVREISSATYTSKWCASADATYIDGGQLYTGSVTADKVKANEIFTQKLYAQDFNITGGSVHITTASETDDIIALNCGDFTAKISPSELYMSVEEIPGIANKEWLELDNLRLAFKTFDDNDQTINRTVYSAFGLSVYDINGLPTDQLGGGSLKTDRIFPLNQSASYIQDFIVEAGSVTPSSGVTWYFRKWYSGYAEAWLRKSVTLSFSTSWGGLRKATIPSENYPFQFRSGTQPIEWVSAVGSQSGTDKDCIIGNLGGNNGPNDTHTGQYLALRSTTGSATIRIAYYVRGLL